MAEENIISVTNNENPPINLEIVSYKNEVGVSYIQGKGDKGDTGEKGDKGEKGEKGDLGVSTMLVSSFTGAINGSNNTFILNDNYDNVIVFINGIKYGSADYTYTKTTKTVTFGFAIPTSYTLEFYGVTNKNAQVVPLQDLSTVASSGSYNDLLNKPSIPGKTSDLTNDSHFAVDTNYVHTDNNFTTALKSNYDTAYTNNHTHSNTIALNNVSGTNTGDETASSIKSKLGITTLTGSNTGDQDLSGLVTKTTTINGRALNSNIAITATDVGAPTISSGNGAPTSTPAKIGDIYIDTTNYKTYISKGASAAADWIKQNGSTMVHCASMIRAIATGTTFNFGGHYGSAPIATGSGEFAVRMYVPRTGTITKCYINFIHSAVASAETSSAWIRVNNTTDYLINNSINNAGWQTFFNNTALNIAMSAGDYFWIKWTSPASYVTSPVQFGIMADVQFDY